MYERGARRWLVLALFLGPSLAGVVLFVAGPIVASLALAFSSWDLLTPPPSSACATSSGFRATSSSGPPCATR